MPTVRLRSGLLLAAAILAALSFPAAAQAGGSGGAVALVDSQRAVNSGPSGGAAVGEKPPGRPRRASKRRKPPAPIPGGTGTEAGHFFPVNGSYTLGGKDSRFGAKRSGHRHQGQDIAAAEGVPVVAPFAGTVEYVRFQRKGAGWYIVLDGDGEDRDYVFMHLRRGSILVTPAQQVTAGQQIAEVGNTGRSSGAHLHFEVWVGGWFEKGGAPVDPLPLLQQWQPA